MTIPTAMLLAAVPAALVILAAAVIRHAGPPEHAARRVLVLLEIVALALLALLTALPYLLPDTNAYFWVYYLFIPVIFGCILATLIQLPQIRRFSKKEALPILLLALMIAGLTAYHLREPSSLMMVAPAAVFALGAAWLSRVKRSRWVWVLPVISVLMWSISNAPLSSEAITSLSPAAQLIFRVSMISAPVFSVAVMALFVHTGLNLLRPPGPSAEPQSSARVEGSLRLLAALGLLALSIYSTVWASIWDQTTDGMGGLFFSQLASLTALVCGMLLSLRSRGWRRLVWIAFAVIVGGTVNAGFEAAWQISFPELTERRAERISQALERFHRREDRYPQDLSELVPRDLLYVPQPVMFRGEHWCYQGTAREYRLAAFFHEYFGLPVSLRVYASAGDLEGQPLPCQERLAGMQERYDWTRMQPVRAQNEPQPSPQPTQLAAADIPREPLAPVFSTGKAILPGRWSPDGQWWFFRVPAADGSRTDLHFLEAATGRICSGPTLPYNMYTDRSQAVWLAGGRLLYLDGSPQPPIVTPCAPDLDHFTAAPAGVTLTQVNATERLFGRALLQSQNAYWILEPSTETLQQIQVVQPPQYEARWDHAAWDPTGEILVISHMNSRSAKDGATLYRLNAQTGQVISRLLLEQTAEQSAPMVEWVTRDLLLVHSPAALTLMDFRASPPARTDVIRELMNLDIEYPNQIHGWASLPDKDGSGYHLMVWANHPRNQSLVIYHSETGQRAAFQPGSQVVLLFADGQWLRMFRIDDSDPTTESITLQAVDSASSLYFQVNGHLPRRYPLLDVQALPEQNRMVLASSNGVSLVQIPGGELLHFWQIDPGSEIGPSLIAAPDGSTVLAVVNGAGIWKIPIKE